MGQLRKTGEKGRQVWMSGHKEFRPRPENDGLLASSTRCPPILALAPATLSRSFEDQEAKEVSLDGLSLCLIPAIFLRFVGLGFGKVGFRTWSLGRLRL